jgi:tocopherol O-methyltransferase
MIVPRTELSGSAVASHYDDLDRFYRELWGEHVHHGLWRTGRESPEEAVLQLIAMVAERTSVAPGDRVCDVGCGYGGTSRVLARDYGAEVTALTISPAQHAYAAALDPSSANPTYLLGDWCDNRLPSDHFDVVFSIESSEHMPDKAAFFAEVRRVLKPGGRFAVCAWLATDRPKRWEVRHLLEPICREGRLPGMGTADEYHELARASGLDPVGFDDLSRQVKKTWPVCAMRVVKGLVREREYRKFLLWGKSPDRIFALTVLRIWAAYETGSMRYGLLSAVKPADVAAANGSPPAGLERESEGVACR